MSSHDSSYGASKFEIGAYEDAFELGKGKGKTFDTLGELVRFVLYAVKSQGLLKFMYEPGSLTTKVEPHKWWFRGANYDWKLNSKLFRLETEGCEYPGEGTKSLRALERAMRHEYYFMTRGRFAGISNNPWDRLFEMQHYGMPTRLLDWSLSLGQALWFALQPPDGDGKPYRPTIWMLYPRLLSKASLGELALNDFSYLELNGTKWEVEDWNCEKLRNVVAKEPRAERPGEILDVFSDEIVGHVPVPASWTNPRLAAQMGCFTLQCGPDKSKSMSLDKYAETTAKDENGIRFLLKLCLDPNVGEESRDALGLIGVNEYTLFPELKSTCDWIKRLRGLGR